MKPAVIAIIAIAVVTVVAYSVIASTQVEFDDSVNGDTPLGTGVTAVAQAIAKAEGFGIVGAIPTLANNPGDLVIPNWGGGTLGEGISVFGSVSEGWSRLYHQLNLIASGTSAVYSPTMSISDVANKWTTTNKTAWASIVSGALGVDPSTPIGGLLS